MLTTATCYSSSVSHNQFILPSALPSAPPAAAGSLSVVEVGPKLVKFAAGAYIGTLEAPEQMAVFLYHLDVSWVTGGWSGYV